MNAAQVLFSRHPLAILAVATAAGIFAARLFVPPLVLVLGCAGGCAAIALYLVQRNRTPRATAAVLLLAFTGVGAALGIVSSDLGLSTRLAASFTRGDLQFGDPIEITGVLDRAPEPGPDSFYLTLRVQEYRFEDRATPATGVVQLVAPVSSADALLQYQALDLRYGARIRVMTELARPEAFRNPGVSPLSEYLETRGFDGIGTIKSPLLIERLDDERVFLPFALVFEWRQRLLGEIMNRFSPDTAAVLAAALLGDRSGLSHATADRFRDGGTFHLLVISGLHVGFVGFLCLLAARVVTERRWLRVVLGSLLLWVYVFGVGADNSVVRAAIMFTAVGFAPLAHRNSHSLNALGGAALILLVVRPADLFDASFQLTMLAVLSIVMLAAPFLGKLKATGTWRPARATPYPPHAPVWLRGLGEMLFCSEKEWKREMDGSSYSYRLFKLPLAARLERLRLQWPARMVFSAVVVTVSVQAGLLPLLVFYFHRVSIASLFLNIFSGVLMAGLALTAAIALLFAQVNASLAVPFLRLAEGLGTAIIHGIDPFERWGIAAVRIPQYSGPASAIYGFYYVALALIAFSLALWQPLGGTHSGGKASQGRARALIASPAFQAQAFAAALLLVLAHPFSSGLADGRLRVDFLDVGQGDSALITMPDGTTMLVDGGGRPNPASHWSPAVDEEGAPEFERDRRSIGERVVSEYLWWRGLDRIDYILATHADADHINGLNDVARNFKVRAAFVARTPSKNEEYVRFAATMQRAGVPVEIIGSGDLLRFGAVEALALWPERLLNSDAPSRNNDSVVLRLHFGSRTFLLTGDLERDGENAILSKPEMVRCDVIKVGHHGSHTSSTENFVRAARAAYAIVSVGLTSPFGHPSREIVQRWRDSGASVITTGEAGTITISTNGEDLRFSTFVPPK